MTEQKWRLFLRDYGKHHDEALTCERIKMNVKVQHTRRQHCVLKLQFHQQPVRSDTMHYNNHEFECKQDKKYIKKKVT